eukprot:CAMPEP_0116884882 /NCGR_PEP_ID=MMETSP0463-20121206/17973_1 /TAXON_ID=181622 /ORGANISM="Strombidinopsis sp, Strain SopsisLIS2011" /LENGTH=32 /DNA_ID= /DNA_START= /DNA_END= /DNA_ORIENTATION=
MISKLASKITENSENSIVPNKAICIANVLDLT